MEFGIGLGKVLHLWRIWVLSYMEWIRKPFPWQDDIFVNILIRSYKNKRVVNSSRTLFNYENTGFKLFNEIQ